MFLYFVIIAALVHRIASQVDEKGKIDAFTKWFEKNQGVLNGIEVYNFREMGNGFRATSSIQENDLVLKVPNHLILTIENMKDHPSQIIRWFYQYFHSISSEQAIIMWLLYEKNLGILSSFYEYIQILPEKVPSLIYFSDDEVQELQDSWFAEETLAYQREVQTNYQQFLEALRQMLVEKSNDISPIVKQVFLPPARSSSAADGFSVETLQAKFTFDDYLWALSILNSRALRFHGEIHLIPMADIFNYEKHHQPRQQDNGNFFLQHHRLDPKTRSISIYADRNIEAVGEQLFEDYGDNTNQIYLTYHGFVPHFLNPFHCVNFHFQHYWKYLLKDLQSSSSNLFTDLKDINEDTFSRKIDLRQPENQRVIESVLKGLLSKERLELFELLQFPLTSLSSFCLKQDGKIPRQYLVVFSILALSDKQLQTCQSVVKEQIVEAQKSSSSNRKRMNWLKIYEACSLNTVQDFYDKEISDSYAAIASGIKKAPKPSSANQRDANDDDEEEEEEEEEPKTDIQNLAVKAWDKIREFLQATIKELRFPSTIEEDRQILQKIGQLKRSTLGEEERDHWIHLELAVKYRVTNKAYYVHLCAIYDLDCDAMYDNAPSIQADLDKSTHTHEPEKKVKVLETSAPSSSNNFLFADKIDRFNEWFTAHHPAPSKIKAQLFNNHYRVGTVVTAKKITKEELYLGVPVDIILSAEKAFHMPGIQSLVLSLYQKYGRNDEFHELIFFLIYEALMQGEKSQFSPYLSLLPQVEDMRKILPVFWDKETLHQRLLPSHLLVDILNYQQRIQRRFQFLQNITEISSFFKVPVSLNGDSSERLNYFTYDNYLWATAILDSRSIWWDGKRHLVPMLDFINCEENRKDPKRLHATKLDSSKKYAVTYSNDEYEEGDQLFENYGQPNHIYFLYHGFILPDNSHDCIHYNLFFEGNEYSRLKKDGLNDYLENVFYIRSPEDVFVTCLSVPIPQKVWLFLALKENTYRMKPNADHVIDFKEISKPNAKTIKALQAMMKRQLNAYRKSREEIGHEMSFSFLESEQSMVRFILKQLSQLPQVSEEEEDPYAEDEL